MQPIRLPNNAQFFVAICKEGEHSWITLGALNPETGVNHTLAYFGKRLAYAKHYQCAGRCKTMFSTVPGVLTRDYKFKNAFNHDQPLDFEYKAFAISWGNYLEFARQMKGLVKDKYADHDDKTKEYHKNELYFPNKENPNQFDFISIEKVDGELKTSIDSNVERLGTSDNCRHTVLSLLKKFLQHGERFAKGISTFAYQALPYKAIYKQDQIIGNFFILPTPPSKDDGDEKLYKIRVRLFERLEKIPTLKQADQATWDKFNAVKSLYESLAPSKQQSLAEALGTITNWESQNAKTIDSCRLFNTSKTKTRQMVEDIKHSLCVAVYNGCIVSNVYCLE
jgi:hypothetical protein